MHENPANVKATELLVKRVKGYVDYDVSKKLHADFNDERNKWKLKIERAESSIKSKIILYSKLIIEHKTNPSIVERYGYILIRLKMRWKVNCLNQKKMKTY